MLYDNFGSANSHDVDAHRVVVEGDVHADSAQHWKQNDTGLYLIVSKNWSYFLISLFFMRIDRICIII